MVELLDLQEVPAPQQTRTPETEEKEQDYGSGSQSSSPNSGVESPSKEEGKGCRRSLSFR